MTPRRTITVTGWPLILAGIGFLLVGATALATGQAVFPPTPSERLANSSNANFGGGVAVDEDVIAVDGDEDLNLFTRGDDGWSITTSIPDSSSSEAVTIDLPWVTKREDGTDELHVHHRTSHGWAHHSTLSVDNEDNFDNFATTASLHNGTLVVGADADDEAAFNAGAAHVYTYNATNDTWDHQTKLVPADASERASFGRTLDIHNDTIVAGAPLDDPNGDFSGSAYVFEESDGEWSQTAKLVAPDGERGDSFGDAVATNGDTIAIGAPFHGLLDRDDIDEDAGTVYTASVHEGNVSELNPLYNPQPGENAQFGRSLAFTMNTLLVGAPGADGLTESTGAAYAYTGTGNIWEPYTRLGPEDANQAGTSLALDAGTAVVGSQFTNHALVYNDILPHTNDTNNDQGCVQASTGEGFTLHASTPTVHENLTIEQRNETVGEEDVFVPGVTVRVGDEEIEAGGEWVHVPGASVGTPGVEASVGPLAASQSASVEQPSVPVDASATGCVQHG